VTWDYVHHNGAQHLDLAQFKQGAAWIKSQGGLIFTEAESSCVVYGMPSVVMEAGLSDKSVALDDMARAIMEIV